MRKRSKLSAVLDFLLMYARLTAGMNAEERVQFLKENAK